jgi:hypothetical protein
MGKIQFTEGSQDIRERVKKYARFSRSCDNCNDFYQAPRDTEELCHNNNVLQYDICSEGSRVYCSFWNGVKKGVD